MLSGQMPHHRSWVTRHGAVAAVAAGADLVAAGMVSGEIVLFDRVPADIQGAQDMWNRREQTVRAHAGKVVALELYGADSILSAGEDGFLSCWRVTTGDVTSVVTLSHGLVGSESSGRINDVNVSVIGYEFCTCGDDARVAVWKQAEGGEVVLDDDLQHSHQLACCAYDRSGVVIAAGGHDGSICVWNRLSKLSLRVRAHSYSIFDLAWLPSGSLLIVSGAGVVKVFDGLLQQTESNATALAASDRPERGSDALLASNPWGVLAIATSDSMLACGGGGGETRVGQLTEGEGQMEERVLYSDAEAGAVYACAVSQTQQGQGLVASAYWKGVAGGEQYGLLVIVSVTETGDGQGSPMDAECERCWRLNPETHECTRGHRMERTRGQCPGRERGVQLRLECEEGLVGVAFSPIDSQLVALASLDKRVMLVRWSPDAAPSVQSFVGHDNKVRAVSFAPDGLLLASASEDNTVGIWEIAANPSPTDADAMTDVTARMKLRRTLEGHQSWVRHVAFSPVKYEGTTHLVASCGADKTVRVWDAEQGTPFFVVRTHFDIAWAVSFSSDGQRLASCSEDGTLVVTELKTQREVACYTTLVGTRAASFWGADMVVVGLPDGSLHVSRY